MSGVVPPKVLTGMCVLVAAVWAVSIGLDMINPAYEPDPAINAIFGGVVGTALGLGKNGGNKRDDGKDGGKRDRDRERRR